MKERPILFSGPMVRAILEGKKTQTRRIVKPQPCLVDTLDFSGKVWIWHPGKVWKTSSRSIWVENCPYGVPGDRLWVRESIRLEPEDIFYRADGTSLDLAVLLPEQLEWLANYGSDDRTNLTVPSIHMPRWASRLMPEVVEVRVERLQDISEDDARAEGVSPDGYIKARPVTYHEGEFQHTAFRDTFRGLWDSINAKRGFGWDVNPWVWAISFPRQVEGEAI